ncbi:MAG TPA: hypothetical protein VLG92_04385 [Candidatus Saccharimonadia bacterium]|nr:hypothetical protein [Candidatus Saccharimonadia bacterium]
MAESNLDFTKLEGARIATVPVDRVPAHIWETLQETHRRFLQSRMIRVLPNDTPQRTLDETVERARQITLGQDTGAYARQYGTHDDLLGQGGRRSRQLRAYPAMTFVIGQGDTLLGAAATVLNTSSPKWALGAVGRIIQERKMTDEHGPFAGHRYVKIGEVVAREPEVAVAALVGALERRSPKDDATMYFAKDPADSHMEYAAGALGMHKAYSELQRDVIGYPQDLEVETHIGRVGDMLLNLNQIDGVATALSQIPRLEPHELPEQWRGETY